MSLTPLERETQAIVGQFEFTDEQINRAAKEFLRQMDEGLEKTDTNLSQIPTYVTGVPNGTEEGLFLAADLGGTNFRVCSVRLMGDGTFNITSEKVFVPQELMTAEKPEDLFGFLALQIQDFLEKYHGEHFAAHMRRRATLSSPDGWRDENAFRMGFTFSFPVAQEGLNKGKLLRWTKGFNIPAAVGEDVCALLQIEVDKRRLPVIVSALVNDTVGTLMARSYGAPGTHGAVLGAIFGTGTNGAYIEKLSNVKKPVTGEYDTSTGDMVINTEWGSFDNQLNVLPTTQYDVDLDEDTPNKGFQMYEKRVSGMFLGEILRRAIEDLRHRPNVSLFQDVNSSTNDRNSTAGVAQDSGLRKPWGVDTSILSSAAGDHTAKLSVLCGALQETLKISAPTKEDAQAFKDIACAIGRRAARLAAVAIGAVVLQSGRLKDPKHKDEPVNVGVDGSLVEHYPYFLDMIYEALRAIDGIGKEGAERIHIDLAPDGSGVGAALIACMAYRMEKSASAAELIDELRSGAKAAAATSENTEKATAD